VSAGGVGPVSGNHLPDSLVYPWYKAFSPRVGLAIRLPKRTVLRTGFGMNYTVGEYATFGSTMAHQPPFTNLQTNVAAAGNQPSTACVQKGTCFTLAQGFTASGQPFGNYALDPHYGLPYLMTWNLDLQKTMPLGIVLNVGYNGSRANHLDVKMAPRALPSSPATNPKGQIFNYDQASAFYKMNAATVRANKRLSHGVSMGANYQFSHAIDNATSVNGSTGAVVQNWLDPAAEAGNSSLVPRHQVTGNYLYELPFGEDRLWATSGKSKRILEGFSISGTFTFASAGWLTPTYTPTAIGVTCGTAGSLRANQVAGVNVVEGGRQWINPAAYSMPSATPGYCNAFGNAARNSIAGPGVLQNNMSLSRTVQMGETRSMEVRANINNVFNTVQFTGVDSMVGSPTFGQVSQVGSMRSFQFTARFRF
jgi:trimeric autotransporter adhesin